LAGELEARFVRREQAEIERLAQVLALARCPTCHTNALVAHFGEMRKTPCGHCAPCLTGRVAPLPALIPLPPLPDDLDVATVRALRAQHPGALGEPRQLARWLSGLPSPALTRAKLTRHALAGSLGRRPFQEVLRWCELDSR
jgi:ATP-dependent DNA helicase RecQ